MFARHAEGEDRLLFRPRAPPAHPCRHARAPSDAMQPLTKVTAAWCSKAKPPQPAAAGRSLSEVVANTESCAITQLLMSGQNPATALHAVFLS